MASGRLARNCWLGIASVRLARNCWLGIASLRLARNCWLGIASKKKEKKERQANFESQFSDYFSTTRDNQNTERFNPPNQASLTLGTNQKGSKFLRSSILPHFLLCPVA